MIMVPRVSFHRPVFIVVMLLLAAALACSVTTSRARFDNARLYKTPAGEDSTRSFKPDDTVYLITTIKNVDGELPLRVVWVHLVEADPAAEDDDDDANDTGDEADREPILIPTEIGQEERAVSDGPVTFELASPAEGWPRGSYQANLYLDGEHKATLPFSIK